MQPTGKMYGYVRVSTNDQHIDRQINALREYGLKETHIYTDYMSGKDFNRPSYKKLIRKIKQGDIIVIKSIDRLGRNYQDIIDQWRLITQDIGCGIHVLDMPTLNTSGDPKDLLSRFITDMILQVLSFVAENERANIKQRQKEGIKAAKARGVDFGRPRAKIPKDFWRYYVRWKSGESAPMDIIKETKMSTRTFYRRIRELDRRYGDFPIDKIKELIIDEDIPYENERPEDFIPKPKKDGTPRLPIPNKKKGPDDVGGDNYVVLVPVDRS